MLSKVLGRAEASNIRSLTFPDLDGYGQNSAVRDSASFATIASGSVGNADTAELREKLRQLEGRIAAERREAFEAGRQQGDQQARTELQPVIERLNASIAEILSLRSDLRSRAERDLVQLALLIAKRILHRELTVDENALAALARVAFDRLTRAESYRITVHPRFASTISSAVPPNSASRVQINPDPNCSPGTLVIHSPEGTIDASVDTQIEEISRGLIDRIG